MATQPVYVPVLKGKEGEYAALEQLAPDIRASLMPLIEIPSVPYDYANERPAKSMDEHVNGIAGRLQRCWSNAPLYLDLPWFEGGEFLEDGRIALEALLTDCVSLGMTPTPVVSLTSSDAYLAAASRFLANTRAGACIRLFVDDFDEDTDLEVEVENLLNGLGGSDKTWIDLIIDLKDLGSKASHAVLIARSVLSVIPRKERWRHIVLAAASFPEDLSDVDAATIKTLPRHEWELWKTLQKRPHVLPRPDLIFGDYAIAHPVPKELDPRVMQMSASIRYTTPNEWLIVKGRNVRQYGFDQYFELCKTLIGRPEYCGRNYSWGDKYIDDCANGMTGPGNATTWRKVGTNHHLTLVTRELAKLLPGA